MADPFREQRLPPDEVRRVLLRALDLADAEPGGPGAERSLTRSEVEQVAGRLGLPATTLDRAFHAEAEPEAKRFASAGFLGAPTRLVYEADLEGAPTEEDREDLVELIHSVTGELGSLQAVGRSLTWQTTAQPGRGRQLSVRLRTREGRTRLVIEEKLGNTAAGLFVGIGAGAGVGPLGGYILAIVKLGVMGALIPALWIPLVLLLARTIFVAVARRRETHLIELFERIRASSRGWPRGKRRRVEVAATEARGARRDDEGAEEEAAEEEASEAEARGGGRARGR